MNNKNTVSNTGTSISGVLTLIFLVLKLCKVITWGWFWVFSPLVFGTILWVLIYAVLYLIAIKQEKNNLVKAMAKNDQMEELFSLGVDTKKVEEFYGKPLNEFTEEELTDAIYRKKKSLGICEKENK